MRPKPDRIAVMCVACRAVYTPRAFSHVVCPECRCTSWVAVWVAAERSRAA